MNWSYVAGYFDGEGCLQYSIGKSNRAKGSQIDGWGIHSVLTIESCDFEVLKKIKQLLNHSNIYFNYYKRRDEAYCQKRVDGIYLFGENIEKFINKIFPFSIGKKPQLLLYRDFVKIKHSNWGKSKRGKKIWTKETFLKVMEIVEKADTYKKGSKRRKLRINYFKKLWKIR